MEEFRRKKVELKYELLGPEIHIPFNENVLKKTSDLTNPNVPPPPYK